MKFSLNLQQKDMIVYLLAHIIILDSQLNTYTFQLRCFILSFNICKYSEPPI